MTAMEKSLRRLPAVDLLLREPALAAARARLAHETVVGLIREVLDEARAGLLAGREEAPPPPERMAAEIARRAETLLAPTLTRVVNATGILIHTNLGRAPLPASAQEAVRRVAAGYANLEMDLTRGRRASRLDAVRDLLRRLTGAEDAFAVNNNAAAVHLVLRVFAAGREVIVSRGELVEIGGSFRLPDIMEASGAALREVGTTNRTRIDDYRAALTERTALLLKVHPSNFVLRGFTEAAARADLAALARERGVLLVEDQGSGAIDQQPAEWLRGEPRLQQALRDGADLVTCSGDKLLGGPQAGLIIGRRDLIARLRAHPLARVVRLDKLHLAALEATLREYLRGEAGVRAIPLYRMAARTLEELRALGRAVIARLEAEGVPADCCELIETEAAAGGGSLPDEWLPSIAVALTPRGAVDDFARLLRTGEPPIVGRVERDRLVLELRTLLEDEWEALPGWVASHWRAFHRPDGEGQA